MRCICALLNIWFLARKTSYFPPSPLPPWFFSPTVVIVAMVISFYRVCTPLHFLHLHAVTEKGLRSQVCHRFFFQIQLVPVLIFAFAFFFFILSLPPLLIMMVLSSFFFSVSNNNPYLTFPSTLER